MSKERPYTPSQYMRERRPHLFSDSSQVIQHAVTREILSHHLETLTNNKDETAFEKFAHRLCEKFISPNLRPQTGPTGGGDGKIDAETYPVAREIALRWSVNVAHQPGESKAFAFSAKRKWRDKIRADIKSIVGTGRKYNSIYFVTNQFVPAKDCASMQDALYEKYGTTVTILDRTWLLDRVFNHSSLDIAIDELGVGKGAEHQVQKTGPKDFERLAELAELEKKLSDGSDYLDRPHILADDALRAAVLTRSLERSAVEINGQFERALRIAQHYGLKKQEFIVTYKWAWTSHFWLEDHVRTNDLYDNLEKLGLDSNEAEDLGMLCNILPLLRVCVRAGYLTEAVAKIGSRSKALSSALEALAAYTGRPNNALHAKALLLLIRMSERASNNPRDPMIDLWIDFRDVVLQANGLGAFPFQSIADGLTEIGNFIPESAEFDNLYQTITDALASRSSEGEAAAKNVTRGYQKLAKDLPYDAIRWFGRGVHLLVKEEYEEELVRALIGSGLAYEEAGLLWAARNFTLAALTLKFSGLKSASASIREINPAMLQRYFELELKLGRIPQILFAHELDFIVRKAQIRTDGDSEKLLDVAMNREGAIGALILRTAHDDLEKISRLPDALRRLSIPFGRIALLFLMGRLDLLHEEGAFGKEESDDECSKFFNKWHDLGAEIGLPEYPDYGLSETVVLRSRILGCDIQVECATNLVSLGIGEAILGTLEALLATSLEFQIIPLLDHLVLRVVAAPIDKSVLKLEFLEEQGEPIGVITHPKKFEYDSRDQLLAFPNWLKNVVFEIFSKFAMPVEFEKWGDTLFHAEGAFDRSLTFSNVPLMLKNMFGESDHLGIDYWIEENDPAYEIKRSTAWLPKRSKSTKTFGDATPGRGKPPEGMFESFQMKHSDMKIASPIDMEKWDAAHWSAALFISAPTSVNDPPFLGLAYKNLAPARGIFEGLRKRFGESDGQDDLRVAIIRGISAKNPNAYAITIGPNLKRIPAEPGVFVTFVSRIQRMYPATSDNLDRFLREYSKYGRYLLIPAHLPTLEASPVPLFELSIAKNNLLVREAWQIDENDFDAMALVADDPPFIPIGESNVPVLRALEQLKNLKKE